MSGTEFISVYLLHDSGLSVEFFDPEVLFSGGFILDGTLDGFDGHLLCEHMIFIIMELIIIKTFMLQ